MAPSPPTTRQKTTASEGSPGLYRPSERTFEAALACTDLNKSFGKTPALNGITLEVAFAEVVAIMGPSGSGKSTLLHCLAGIVKPESGQVRYRGRDLSAMSESERTALRRNDFGFVFQFGQLVPELNCIENVALPLRLDGTKRREAQKRARVWLERLQVADVAEKTPGEISGGQGQRVAVARALVSEPRIIFADEPTGALDSLNGELVLGLLAQSVRETGASLILVTHEPRVAAYSDREIVIRDGRLAETPT